MKLVDSAIKLYTNIFCSAHLSHKNRIQLCKHLQAHFVLPDNNINKQLSIIMVCYSIARYLSKTPAACGFIQEPDQVFTLFQSIGEFTGTTPNHVLRTLGCELLALLHRAFNESLPGILSSLVTKLEKLTDSNDVWNRSKAVLIIGYLFKHFDTDKLQFFIKSIEKVITKQLNDSHAFSKFYSFFAIYLVLKYTGVTFLDVFKDSLSLCLHNYNTDIRLDKSLFSVICGIFELIIRIQPAADQGKLPIVAFDSFLLSKCNHPVVSTSILKFAKYCVLVTKSVITPRQSIELLLRTLKNSEANTASKKLSLEILGIIAYQGQIKTLQQVDPMIIWELLEELNILKGGKMGMSYAYNKKQAKKSLKLDTWKLDIEKSFGIANRFEYENTHTKFSALIKKSEELLYEYTLKQLIIFIFTKIMEEKGGINTAIDMIKYILNYRLVNEEGLEESKTRALDNNEEIVVKEKVKENSYKFHRNIRMGMKSFIIKLLRKLILNETRESEFILLVNHFPSLLSLSFAYINIESNPKKDSAFKLIKTAIKQCKGIKDTIVQLNDEEETKDLRNGLEQFEAQINALIRQYATKSSSYDALENIFAIFYYFCTIPISRDAGTLAKLMNQIVEPLKGLTVTGSVEFSCEKDALECHLKRLKTLCKLYFIGVNARFNTHSVIKKDDEISFLREENKKSIQELFTPKVTEYMTKHIIAALNDCWFVLTQSKKTAKQKINYVLIHSGVPSAYSVKSCESAVLCFLKYLALCSDKPDMKVVLKENLNVVIPFVMHYLVKKPEPGSSADPGEGDATKKLGAELLHKNDLLLALKLFLGNLPVLEMPGDLLLTCLSFLEKLTDTKIMDFSVNIIEIVNEICSIFMSKASEASTPRVLYACEEILGKIWLQSINPSTQDESKLFIQMYDCWKRILLHYACNPSCEAQFQITFTTIVIGLNSLIPTAENTNSKIYAKLCITILKELLSTPSLESFVKVEVTQFFLNISSMIQSSETSADKVEVLFIIAMNCAIALASSFTDDMTRAFNDFLEILDVSQTQPQILKTAAAIIKAGVAELKNNTLIPMILEHMLQQLYKGIETGECANAGLRLQFVTLLYQVIGSGSEVIYAIIFSMHLGFCTKAFSNTVLKEVLISMNSILTINPAFFKASVERLSQKEIKYLQLLMKLHAVNKIG